MDDITKKDYVVNIFWNSNSIKFEPSFTKYVKLSVWEYIYILQWIYIVNEYKK